MVGRTASAGAARRLAADVPNELPTARKRTFVRQAWDVVREPTLLLGAGAVSFFPSEPLDGGILMSFVVIAISIYQERKTEHTAPDLSRAARGQGPPQSLPHASEPPGLELTSVE